VVAFVTGILWPYFHYFAVVKGDFGDEANPAEPWILKVHGAAAMAFLIILGTLLPKHVYLAWRAKQNRRSGVGLLIIFGILVLTGYGLYYSGNETLRKYVSWIHLGVGVASPLVIVAHIAYGKAVMRRRNRAKSSASRAPRETYNGASKLNEPPQRRTDLPVRSFW
jgi:cation transport ATPase